MTDVTLKKRLIEAYLLEGAAGESYRIYRNTLLTRGYNMADVVELIIAARLYGDAQTFYRKNPQFSMS